MKIVLSGKSGLSVNVPAHDLFGEPVPAYVEKSYDHSWHSWGVRVRDAEGNQIGDSIWVYSKAEAQREVTELCKKYNIKERSTR